MSTQSRSTEELIKVVTRVVVRFLLEQNTAIPIGVSNRHVHLSREDMDILFGKGSQLTKKKDLKQPGQYAAEEVVTIKGPKGAFERVRVLGPLRKETQVEISAGDGFTLGITPPVRESGKLDETPGIELIGPAGTVSKDHGTIAALRHIHMTPDIAKQLGVKDKDIVNVEVGEETGRGAILKNVLLRVSDQYALEMHLDVEEANAVSVTNGQFARIVKEA